MTIIRATSFAALIFVSLVSCETTPPLDDSSAAAATATKPYPLDTCLVTGEGLESKGGSFTMIHEGQEVKVCCLACKMAFKDEPERYLAKLP